MNHIHFRSIHTTPVHKLPTEILTCIFYLALVSVDRCHHPASAGSDSQANPIRYPNCLAHVCSRWRAVALSSPSLWTHIDLTSDISIGGGFLDRACAYVERAGKLPLEVHLDDKGCAGDHDYYDLGSMIQSLSSRVKELDFVITAPKLLDFHGAVLNSIFPELSPKDFKKLRMSSQASLPYPFLSSCDGRANLDGHEWSPNILKWQNYVIDDCFSGVKNLHLQGIFFAWSRKLYHGLVDLRLTSSPTGRVPIIGALDLIAILLKSPELRILHFSLGINMPEDTDNSWSPISLPNLEVVRVSTSRVWSYAATLFRLLKPGSKPLRLTLETGSYEPLLDRGGMNEFFARSKVERLCIRDGNLSMNELRLCNLPDLKVLVFDSCHHLTIEPVPTSPSRWNSCLIHATRLNLYQLRSIFKLCPTGLVLSQYEIYRTLRDGSQELVVSEEELRTAFPTVQFLVDQGLPLDPTADWDILFTDMH